ncbi:MAG TPA: STAS domain-containing protein [Actinomycetospora sp.]|jgi:anti-anti-sigma regulatory factor|uniref:STAS domain-containing protein n=1 Tax=Actinomycetospora sp. TaxID=1872135 RepID=UPI002F40E66A
MTTVVLAGELRGWAVADLAEHCAVLRQEPHAQIVLDMGGVHACDAAGLEVLIALHAGDGGADLVIRGARWSQFFDVLRQTPLEDLGGVCHQVRQLVWSARRVRRIGVDRTERDDGSTPSVTAG